MLCGINKNEQAVASFSQVSAVSMRTHLHSLISLSMKHHTSFKTGDMEVKQDETGAHLVERVKPPVSLGVEERDAVVYLIMRWSRR